MEKFRKPFFRVVLNYFLHKVAAHNLNKYPQLATLAFDHIGLSVNVFGQYEPDNMKLIEALSDKGLIKFGGSYCAVDIGANIGSYSVWLGSRFGEVHAFEPNPRILPLLQYNCQDLPVDIHPYGLSDFAARALLQYSPRNMGGASLCSSGTEKNIIGNVAEVELKVLDDDLAVENPISLIKIDVEDHELNVLRGSKKLIAKHRPVVVFEHSGKRNPAASKEIAAFFENVDYAMFIFEDRKFGRVFELLFGSTYRLSPIKSFEQRFYSLVFAIPCERAVAAYV